jgi:methionine sulfoxide reductase heme-binding subunit
MSNGAIPYVKAAVHVACLLPFVYLWDLYRTHGLAAYADPVNYITHFTGDWALWLLLVTLAVTPVSRLSPSFASLTRFRRMLGLYAFFYATLHLLTYVFLFSGYDMHAAIEGVRQSHLEEPFVQLDAVLPKLLDDMEKRKFVQVGLAAWLLLLMLALTSTEASRRTMGEWLWQGVHRLIYVAAGLAVIHYWWQVKAGVHTPWKVTVVLVVLLLWRVGLSIQKRKAKPRDRAVWPQDQAIR